MIFFITLMLGQMYTLLNTFTDAVLVLRLEETAAGAAIGVAVSFLVLPTGTRATARAARAGFLRQLADLLEGCADHLRARPRTRPPGPHRGSGRVGPAGRAAPTAR